MIVVDICVPELDAVYDFMLEEDVKVSVLQEEIVEMICQWEHISLADALGHFQICFPEHSCALPLNQTLRECGVIDGSQLLLV